MSVYFDTGQSLGSAISEIEYLQRRYARATDLWETNLAESGAYKTAIYQNIFVSNAEITSAEKRDLKLGASEAYASGQAELSAFYSQWGRHNILLLLSLSRFNP